eukprot:10557566-Karenia_brevis.AAC.1
MNIQEFRKAKAASSCFRVCVDGALRKHGGGAAGLAILAYHPDGRRALCYRAGMILQAPGSAFETEMLAMEWGLHTFLDLMSKDEF